MTSFAKYPESVREDNEYTARMDDKNANREEFDYKDSEPVICSKCNVTFGTDDQYLQHYDEKHKL
jgi:hypothetical protein